MIELAIPKVRPGTYFPSLLEPRHRAEQALLAVVQETYVQGASTRKVDDVLKGLRLGRHLEIRVLSDVQRGWPKLRKVADGFRRDFRRRRRCSRTRPGMC
jgi:transposase-like protein